MGQGSPHLSYSPRSDLLMLLSSHVISPRRPYVTPGLTAILCSWQYTGLTYHHHNCLLTLLLIVFFFSFSITSLWAPNGREYVFVYVYVCSCGMGLVRATD